LVLTGGLIYSRNGLYSEDPTRTMPGCRAPIRLKDKQKIGAVFCRKRSVEMKPAVRSPHRSQGSGRLQTYTSGSAPGERKRVHLWHGAIPKTRSRSLVLDNPFRSACRFDPVARLPILVFPLPPAAFIVSAQLAGVCVVAKLFLRLAVLVLVLLVALHRGAVG